MSFTQVFNTQFEEHIRVAQATMQQLEAPFNSFLQACVKALVEDGKKMLIFGNGGSAVDAAHLAGEFIGRFDASVLEKYNMPNRPGLPVIALGNNIASITAISNDYDYDQIFVRELGALGQEGDIALAISTSGNSPNVILAQEKAQEMGMVTAAFCGNDGGKLKNLSDHAMVIPCNQTAIIQEMYMKMGHIMCSIVEEQFVKKLAKEQKAA